MSFLTIFVHPPGDLIYYVLIIAIIMACVLMAAGHHVRRGTRSTARLTIGLGGAFAAWLLLMGGALVNVVGSGGGLSSLQALERAANMLMIISLGWAFLTSDPNVWDSYANRVAIGLAVAVIVLLVFSGGVLNAGLTQAPAAIVLLWLFSPIVLLAGGVALAIVHREKITDAPLKIVFAAVLLSGYTAGVVQYAQNDPNAVLGSVRLAFAAAMGVVAMILYRALVGALVTQLRIIENNAQRPPIVPPAASQAERSPVPQRAAVPSERESAQLLRALGLMIEDTQPAAIPLQLVRATLEMLRADIGALIRVQDANYADVIVGYDRTRKRMVNGLALNLSDQPTLQNVIERLQQRPLFPDRNQSELDDLYTRIGIDKTGPAYFQPLVRDGNLNGVLLVGFPFSDRELSESEAEALKGLGVIAAGLLSLSDSAEDMRLLAEERAIQAIVQGVPLSTLTDEQVLQARQSAMIELQKSRADIDMLTDQVRLMHQHLLRERERLAMALSGTDADLSVSQRITTLSQRQLNLRQERDQLAERLRQMESALSGAAAEGNDEALQTLITSLQSERDDLMAQRERLERQLSELRSVSANPSQVSAVAAATARTMDAEQTSLEDERDQLLRKFEAMQGQLQHFGLDGSPSGIAQLISQLYGERAALMGRITTLASEKDTLAQERSKLNQRLAQLRDSEQQIMQLQREIRNVAADREAIARQRDLLKIQRDELVSRFQAVRKFRERVMERIEILETQLNDTRADYVELAANTADTSAADGSGSLVFELSRAASRIVELERELSAARFRLEAVGNGRELTSEETDMLIGLAQELRTPITSMRGYVDLMLKESVGILGDMQRKFLQRVAVNASRLSNMIEDLVRIAALDAGRVELQRVDVDLVDVVEDAVTEVHTALREKGIELDLELAEGAPSVIGDPDALKQVVLQLLTNAYLVSPSGSVMRVAVSPHTFEGEDRKQHSGGLLVVENQGSGIATEDLPDVFQRRFTGENPLVPGLGDTGVGLAIAKALVEMHNGQIWVESQPGSGTRFSVLLSAETE
jgi:signal transduction histidine kinase